MNYLCEKYCGNSNIIAITYLLGRVYNRKECLIMVYVINHNGKPLMPCSNVIDRLLLKQGKAKVKEGVKT